MIMRWIVFVCLLLAGRGYGEVKDVTYAERLGWEAGTRVVIFHVDAARC